MENLDKTSSQEKEYFSNTSFVTTPEQASSFIVLTVGGEFFAVEIGRVREIIRLPAITWLPGAPASIKGIVNLRGVVVAVVDLAVLFSHSQLEIEPKSRIVIVESAGASVGLLVEEVIGVEEIPASSQEAAMRTLDESQHSFISAQSDLRGKMTGILDIDGLVEQARPAESRSTGVIQVNRQMGV